MTTLISNHPLGLLPSEDVVSVSAEEAGNFRRGGFLIWGANSRSKAIRARNLLGWSPTGTAIQDEVTNLVDIEARGLGLTQGHAARVAG